MISIFVVSSLICLGVLLWQYYRHPLESMSGPKGYPLIGIGLTLPLHAPQVFRTWALEYGEIFKLRVGWYNWVVINSPEAFKEIFDKQSISTSSKIPAPIGNDLVAGNMRMFTIPYGPKWRTHRSLMHQLLSPKMTLTFVPSQEFEVKQFLYELVYDNANGNDCYNHARRLSFSIIMTSAYGRRIQTWDHEDVRAAGETSKLLGKITRPGAFIEDDIPPLSKLPHWMQPSHKTATRYADIILKSKMRPWNRLKEEIEKGIAAPSFGKDLMNMNLASQGLTEEDGAWIVGGLIEAGSEITAVVINNLMLYLAATPVSQERANEELTSVVGSHRSPTFADIPNLPYIRACVKEILRLCPVPTWAIKHFVDNDIVYKQHLIPKGTVILANTSFMHYDPARYEEPHLFKPERYINHTRSSAEYAAMADPYERDHFTFGGGRRICPASRLAENTLDIIAANVLWAFELRPPMEADGDGVKKEGKIDTSDHAFEQGAFRAPKPFKVRFVSRSKKRERIVKEQWERAREEGYELRGMTVGADGLVMR